MLKKANNYSLVIVGIVAVVAVVALFKMSGSSSSIEVEQEFVTEDITGNAVATVNNMQVKGATCNVLKSGSINYTTYGSSYPIRVNPKQSYCGTSEITVPKTDVVSYSYRCQNGKLYNGTVVCSNGCDSATGKCKTTVVPSSSLSQQIQCSGFKNATKTMINLSFPINTFDGYTSSVIQEKSIIQENKTFCSSTIGGYDITSLSCENGILKNKTISCKQYDCVDGVCLKPSCKEYKASNGTMMVNYLEMDKGKYSWGYGKSKNISKQMCNGNNLIVYSCYKQNNTLQKQYINCENGCNLNTDVCNQNYCSEFKNATNGEIYINATLYWENYNNYYFTSYYVTYAKEKPYCLNSNESAIYRCTSGLLNTEKIKCKDGCNWSTGGCKTTTIQTSSLVVQDFSCNLINETHFNMTYPDGDIYPTKIGESNCGNYIYGQSSYQPTNATLMYSYNCSGSKLYNITQKCPKGCVISAGTCKE